MLTPAQLVSVNPADLTTKLAPVFIVVFATFGAMHLIAGVLFLLDFLKKRSIMRAVKSADCGFRLLPDGAWTWTFALPVRISADIRIHG